MERRRRSIAKAISWRFFATIITVSIVWALTGRLEFAATVGLIDTVIKIFIFFFHERIWLKIPYGKMPPSEEYEI